MINRKTLLYIAFLFVGLMLYQSWSNDYHRTSTSPGLTDKMAAIVSSSPASTPAAGGRASEIVGANATASSSTTGVTENAIQVKTDVLSVKIDPKNGNIVEGLLLAYPQKLQEPNNPFQLFSLNSENYYTAQSGVMVNTAEGPLRDEVIYFQSTQTQYQLPSDQNSLVVKLQGKTSQGLIVEKTYTFKRNNYLVDLTTQIINPTPTIFNTQFYTELLRRKTAEHKQSMFSLSSYTGASYSSPPDKLYKKLSFSKMETANLNQQIKGGWLAMQEHYFLSAWVPSQDQNYRYYSQANANDIFTIGLATEVKPLAPNQKLEYKAQLYAGPEVAATLKTIAPGLDMTIDYGWLWMISNALFWLLKHIHAVVGNWGWSIVILTILIKLVFHHLSATSYRSMAKLREVQPRMQALKQRHGDDKQALSQAIMKIYKEEKLNPLGGCLPIIVQIPFFIALYWVLLESVELRQAPFMLWIKDLSAPDPFHILPLIMGLTMFVQQKMSPAPPDPTQEKIMLLMPVFFIFIFWSFPAGLVLYWVVNNTVSIAQQWYITRQFELKRKKQKAKKAVGKTRK